MQQLSLTYFWPLTEQISLDLDYKPCKDYEEEKQKNTLSCWGGVTNCQLVSNGNTAVWSGSVTPHIVVYPEKTPITIRTEKKPSILARWIYKIIGAKWEKA